MKWKIKHEFFGEPAFFTEDTAPKWLTSENTVPGSTMDNRWFWEDHVKKMKVGESIYTDFHTITRIE